MAATSNTLKSQGRPSLLRRIRDWLRAFEEAMDYDPHEYHFESAQALKQEVEKLKLRLTELEGPQKASDW